MEHGRNGYYVGSADRRIGHLSFSEKKAVAGPVLTIPYQYRRSRTEYERYVERPTRNLIRKAAGVEATTSDR